MINIEAARTETAVQSENKDEGKSNVVKLETAKRKPAKAAKLETKKATPKSGKKITKLAKECPVRKGSNRAKWWNLLKNGMTTGEASEAGVPARFIKKMVKAKHLKVAA
jgi:hypothetical protein